MICSSLCRSLGMSDNVVWWATLPDVDVLANLSVMFISLA